MVSGALKITEVSLKLPKELGGVFFFFGCTGNTGTIETGVKSVSRQQRSLVGTQCVGVQCVIMFVCLQRQSVCFWPGYAACLSSCPVTSHPMWGSLVSLSSRVFSRGGRH